jgi:hypothetical protein
MSDLLNDILEVLKANGPLKAKRIALALDPTRTHITRSEVNSTLYKAKGLKGLSKNDEDKWSYEVESVTKIAFNCSGAWLKAFSMESFLKSYPNLLTSDNEIEFDFTDKLLFLDCILKILSFTNQLVQAGSSVTLKFNKNSDGFTYLQRCGFFDNLNSKVKVLPFRPKYSLSEIYHENSENLFEILPITKSRDDLLLNRINRIVKHKLPKNHSNKLLHTILTLISELVGNIFEHGLSEIPGYIVLQVYQSKKVVISISDSGHGLINTLRDEALNYYSDNDDLQKLKAQNTLNDLYLIGYVFNKGRVSRTGETRRGLGLSNSNRVITDILVNENVWVKLAIRQNNYEFTFPFNEDGIVLNSHNMQQNLTHIRGTHYVITIKT